MAKPMLRESRAKPTNGRKSNETVHDVNALDIMRNAVALRRKGREAAACGDFKRAAEWIAIAREKAARKESTPLGQDRSKSPE
jgi:hypothetical protein